MRSELSAEPRMRVFVAAFLGALIVAACAVGTPPSPTAGPTAGPTADPTAGTTTGPTATPQPTPTEPAGDLPSDILQIIIDDAAIRAGVSADAVTVVRAEAVTWSDSSLGCPQPDMMYLPVLTEGFWVVLDVAGAEYDFRGTERNFILCEIPPDQRQPPVQP
jgi:hypothetical protein